MVATPSKRHINKKIMDFSKLLFNYYNINQMMNQLLRSYFISKYKKIFSKCYPIIKEKQMAEEELEFETEKIAPEEEELFRNALYKVITIVPYVENPEKRIYTLNQDQLDEFLEAYNEYAEYLISIEKISN